MIPEFENLDSFETELMLKAPLLICILVAGADGHIDNKEIKKAISIGKLKQRHARLELINYYTEVGQDFEDKLKVLLASYPHDAKERNKLITKELSELNEVMPKLDATFSSELYTSFLSIARQIAESSGGLLGYNSIGEAEAELISLPMIKQP